MTLEIGRLCVKTTGRDARGKCVIVDIINDNYVLIDGQVRRRKCNVNHLEPLDKVLKIKKGATHEEIVHEFKKTKIEIKERKSKPKTERPRKKRKAKEEIKEEKELIKKEKKKIEKKTFKETKKETKVKKK